MDKKVTFHLDTWQMFLFIKGCLTSASEQCYVWESFISVYHKILNQQQRDMLWALVYRDIYLVSNDNNTYLQYWDSMKRFLAAYNLHNKIYVIIQHPEKGKITVPVYNYQGTYWLYDSMTQFMPKEWVLSTFVKKSEYHHNNEHLGLVPTSAYEDLSLYQ